MMPDLNAIPISGTVPTLICVVPPGPVDATFITESGTAYLGGGTNLTTANGYPVTPVTPYSFSQPATSAGAFMYALPASGTVTVAFSITAAS
jgi:hypothetical protein